MSTSAGIELRDGRLARRWSLRELADRAGVSVASAQAAESGRAVSLETYARLAVALGRRPVLSFPGRAAADTNERLRIGRDLVHAAMGEIEARQLAALGYQVALDEPYQHYQFAGRADVLAWDLEARALLHLENKSRLSDLQDVAGSYNAKRTYLPAVLADRLGIGPRGWATVTHALVVLWSSEVLHVLRLRAGTFRALCPSPIDPFAAWWSGSRPTAATTSSLVVLDPSPSLSSRRRRFVGIERVPDLEPRYRDYTAAAALLGR
jgi:transcriptional regulator with XRE-family HTH domain